MTLENLHPKFPDSDHCQTCGDPYPCPTLTASRGATGAQLPDRGGDIIADIAIALAQQVDLSDEHRAVLARFEALASERDRLRTAWESARRRAVNLRTQLGDARRWGRILEAQRAALRREVRAESAQVSAARDERDQALRAAREATGRLPEEDMVEPGDEVPALAELADRVAALETAVDAHLGTTDEDPPARYRDRDGDLWEQTGPGHLRLAHPQLLSVGMARPYDVVSNEFGPLTPHPAPEPSVPCDTCGRAPDEQETGPDGRCRHTPATRLGRPRDKWNGGAQ